jgi:hypothetical protein
MNPTHTEIVGGELRHRASQDFSIGMTFAPKEL